MENEQNTKMSNTISYINVENPKTDLQPADIFKKSLLKNKLIFSLYTECKGRETKPNKLINFEVSNGAGYLSLFLQKIRDTCKLNQIGTFKNLQFNFISWYLKRV